MADYADNTHPETVQYPTDWHEALAWYQACRQHSDDLPGSTPDKIKGAAVDAYCDAMDHLIEKIPAPDGEGLLQKFDLALDRCGGDNLYEDYISAIRADLERLIFPPVPAPANPAIDWLARQDPFVIFEAIRAAYDAGRWKVREEEREAEDGFIHARKAMMDTPPATWIQFCILLDWVCGEDAAPIPDDLFIVRDRARALAGATS